MQITRRYTAAGQDPFAGHPVRAADVADRQPGRLGRLRDEGRAGPGELVAGGGRHPGAEVLPPGRRAARSSSTVAEAGVPGVAAAQPARPTATAHRRRDRRPAGLPPPGRLLDVLGLEGRLLLQPRPTPARSSTRPATCWPRRWRPRTARSGSTPACTGPTASKGPPQGHYYVDPHTGEMTRSTSRLRAAGPARVLHPVDQRRPRQRRRHHGPVGPRGPHLQVRLAAPAPTSPTCAARASRSPAAASRQRPDELPQDRRPRRRRHQVAAAPPAAPPRWSCSISTIPTSKSSSTGR